MANTIAAAQLARAIDPYADDITILSLDCFDTLLWRTTHAATDLFSELDCGPRIRLWSEALQRQFNRCSHAYDEVTLSEIHRRAYPDATPDELVLRIRQELNVEHQHCFGFAGAIELIRKAKHRGLKVIVVSDTYLNERELRELIAHAAGESVAALIDAIFCSSDYGCSKGQGLFLQVLRALKVTAKTILHVGDNLHADHDAANQAGIRGLHMLQFNSELAQRFRLEAAAGLIMDSRLKDTKPVIQLHRAPLAVAWPALDSAAARVGYGCLGPILVAYTCWLEEQLQTLAQQHPPGQLRPLFLMRDGFMPLQVFNQTGEHATWNAQAVELSRYCAFAASFTDQSSVLEYLTELGGTGRLDILCNQLLFDESESAKLISVSEQDSPVQKLILQAFTKQILRAENLQKILARSSAFADRLCRYLQQQAGVEAGQVLVFCDLGYAGTIQTRLAPILRERLNVSIVGRYLLLRDMPAWRSDKAALLGPDHYDHRTLDALAAYVAVVEQLCTADCASTIDYGQDAEPIRKTGDLKSQQSTQRQHAQRACLEYANDWRQAFERRPDAGGIDAQRTTALQVISRLMFTPNAEEIELFAEFEHDLNLGVDERVKLLDPQTARNGLLRNGLFYTNNNPRQYLPAELRDAGMDLSLNVLLLRRFAPDLRHPDFQGTALSLPIIVADERRIMPSSVQANPTREGYFVACVPIGDCRLSIGLKFGENFEWLQLFSIDAAPVDEMMTDSPDTLPQDLLSTLVHEGIKIHANGLMQCESRASFALVSPPKRLSDRPFALTLVFRPIAPWPAATHPADDDRTRATDIEAKSEARSDARSNADNLETIQG